MSESYQTPAFPVMRTGRESDGMTLRDYFAAKAMAAYIASRTEGEYHHIACWSYAFADAMLEERDRG